jgi:hypothetical protein
MSHQPLSSTLSHQHQTCHRSCHSSEPLKPTRACWQCLGNGQVLPDPPCPLLALSQAVTVRARVPSWAHPQMHLPSPVGIQASPQKPDSSTTALKHRINSGSTLGELGHYSSHTTTYSIISMGKCVLSSKQSNYKWNRGTPRFKSLF